MELAAAGDRPAEIARRLGVPVSTIGRWCRGDGRVARAYARDATCPRCAPSPSTRSSTPICSAPISATATSTSAAAPSPRCPSTAPIAGRPSPRRYGGPFAR
ncbi:hypothetical protein [Actinomycetospora cinnamomea]|uniref:hypothetical protein n=1 Tax=Actinomycetospora cinnamomea TaxID=663609 RepID=UPI003C2FF438